MNGDLTGVDIGVFRALIVDAEAAPVTVKASESAFQFKTKGEQIRYLITLGLTPDRARQISPT